MASEVGVLFTKKFRGRVKVCPDMAQGIEKVGDRVIRKRAEEYRGIFSESLVFYGFDGSRDSNIARAARDYHDAGKPFIYLDLAYWMRRWRGDRYGYHRFAVGNRHPTAYFQKFKHKSDRANAVSVRIEPWKKPGKHIVLCGMSEKCANFEGFEFEEWEKRAVKAIRAVTDRPIHYRPKPNRDIRLYRPIDGTIYRPATGADKYLEHQLRGAWAVVSHHSNAGIDAICHGVPCFSDEGVTTAIGHTDLSLIESPVIPTMEERRQWVNDIAYCQWNREEMRSGQVWRHLKDEGLVP
jgi:hypothetical protein